MRIWILRGWMVSFAVVSLVLGNGRDQALWGRVADALMCLVVAAHLRNENGAQ